MGQQLTIMILSGVEDGALLSFDSQNGDGKIIEERWTITVGRRDENDVCLRNDTFVSRFHAKIHWKDNHWWLEDCDSTNGSFIENPNDFFEDTRVRGIVPIVENQPFRIGRTWLRIQPTEA